MARNCSTVGGAGAERKKLAVHLFEFLALFRRSTVNEVPAIRRLVDVLEKYAPERWGNRVAGPVDRNGDACRLGSGD